MKQPLLVSLLISFILLSNHSKSIAQTAWEEIGVPFTGRIAQMAESPDGTVYAIAYYYGLYSNVNRSMDRGMTWENLQIPNYSRVAINSDGVIYLLKHDQVVRSSDGGETWEVILTGESLATIAISKENVIAVGSVHWQGPYVKVSFDGGETWPTVFDYNYTEQMYLYFNSKEDLFMATENYLLRSSDYAQTFIWLTTIGANYEQNSHHALAFGTNDEIYYGVYFGNGLFRSVDNGDTWERVLNSGTQTIALNSFNEVFAGHYRSLDGYNWSMMSEFANTPVYKIFIGKNNIIYVSTNYGLSVSEDNGATWRVSQLGLINAEITEVKSFARHTFLVKNGIVFRSSDQGNSWQECIIPTTTMESIYISPEGIVYAIGSYSNWIGDYYVTMRSSDFGETWDSFVHIPVNDMAFANGETMFIISELALHRSEDNGVYWEKLASVPECFEPRYMIADADGIIYVNSTGCGNGVVHVSADNGNSWTEGYLPGGAEANRLHANSKGDVFARQYDGGIYVTKDKGMTWTQVETQPWFEQVRVLEIDRNDNLFVSSEAGIFQSGDDGDTWTLLNDGLPNNYYFKLDAGEPGWLYTATASGKVFRMQSYKVNTDNPVNDMLAVYPNPARGNVYITLESFAPGISHEMDITDMSGRKVLSTTIKDSPAVVDINGLDAGIYVVMVNGVAGKLIVR